jgi:DNA-binding transcriptional LysR family regulator
LSLTKAGIELGKSEAAVSQRVKSLEQRLDTKLYEARTGKTNDCRIYSIHYRLKKYSQ